MSDTTAERPLPAMPKTTELAAYVRKLEERIEALERLSWAVGQETASPKSRSADYCPGCGSRLGLPHFDHCEHYVPRKVS